MGGAERKLDERPISGASGWAFFVFVVGLAVCVLPIGGLLAAVQLSANGNAWPMVVWALLAIVFPVGWVTIRRHRALSRAHLIERAAVASLLLQAPLIPIAVGMMSL